ncbi:ubiquitin- protein ligase, putative, partial [Ichthyophthirius multifiliis]
LKCKQQDNIQIIFINEFGNQEKGLDQGGLFKEFLISLTEIIFDKNFELFQQNEQYQLYPNESSEVNFGKNHLEIFHFIGNILGKVIYYNLQIEPVFSIFFLRHIIGKNNSFKELKYYDKQIYKNLKYIYQTQNIQDLQLTFEITNPIKQQIELCFNGKNIQVDNQNKKNFINLFAYQKMTKSIENQLNHFLNGFYEIIPKQWLMLFNEHEISEIISGQNNIINIQDLRNNTQYENGYTSENIYILQFWEVLESLKNIQKCLFIKFVTSNSKQPLFGFKNLQPNFIIYKVSSQNNQKLPFSQTCYNKLFLPQYSNVQILKDKLLNAIYEGQQSFYLN